MGNPVEGELRIRVTEDADFDNSLKDWDESLREETRARLDSGAWTAYQIDVQRAVPGRWEYVAGLGESIHDSGLEGVFASPDDITDESLRETVKGVWEEAQAEEYVPDHVTPSRKPRLIFNAGEFRDLYQELREDRPYPMRLVDGTEIEVVAGDPSSGQLGVEHADLDEIRISGNSL
ncbi:hypothetical protein [Streptomyces sp. CBMA29]|uniref:hypothetical protein n=1 Tax=Streptomyces sp. CBMA29 TaxID=1896314 RepID=UPI001661F8FD|nr:hypothetical protein [Streptomyces sp. CBMA29]